MWRLALRMALISLSLYLCPLQCDCAERVFVYLLLESGLTLSLALANRYGRSDGVLNTKLSLKRSYVFLLMESCLAAMRISLGQPAGCAPITPITVSESWPTTMYMREAIPVKPASLG